MSPLALMIDAVMGVVVDEPWSVTCWSVGVLPPPVPDNPLPSPTNEPENEPDRIPIVEPLILVVTLYITVQALDYYFPKVVPGGYWCLL